MANLTDAFARNNPIWNGRTFQEVVATLAGPGLTDAIKIKGSYVHISNQSGAEVEVLTTVENQLALAAKGLALLDNGTLSTAVDANAVIALKGGGGDCVLTWFR